jgi:uncharacterized protein (TIGR02246 family)
MSETNEAVLQRANAAVLAGDHEGFLSHCTDDVQWTFVGERTLNGKEAVRRYMNATYLEPPRFTVALGEQPRVAKRPAWIASGRTAALPEVERAPPPARGPARGRAGPRARHDQYFTEQPYGCVCVTAMGCPASPASSAART